MQEHKNKDESVANKLMSLAIALTEDNIKRYENLVGIGYKNPTRKLMSAYIESGISPDDKEQSEQFFRFYLSADPDMTVHRAKIYSRLALENKKGSKVTVEQFGIIDTLLINKKWTVGGLVLWIILTAVVVGAILGSFFLFPPLFLTVLSLGGLSWGVATFVIGLFVLAKGKGSLIRMIGEINSIVKAQSFINKGNLDDKPKAALKTLLIVREFRCEYQIQGGLTDSLKKFLKKLTHYKVLEKFEVSETKNYLVYKETNERVSAKDLLSECYKQFAENGKKSYLGSEEGVIEGRNRDEEEEEFKEKKYPKSHKRKQKTKKEDKKPSTPMELKPKEIDYGLITQKLKSEVPLGKDVFETMRQSATDMTQEHNKISKMLEGKLNNSLLKGYFERVTSIVKNSPFYLLANCESDEKSVASVLAAIKEDQLLEWVRNVRQLVVNYSDVLIKLNEVLDTNSKVNEAFLLNLIKQPHELLEQLYLLKQAHGEKGALDDAEKESEQVESLNNIIEILEKALKDTKSEGCAAKLEHPVAMEYSLCFGNDKEEKEERKEKAHGIDEEDELTKQHANAFRVLRELSDTQIAFADSMRQLSDLINEIVKDDSKNALWKGILTDEEKLFLANQCKHFDTLSHNFLLFLNDYFDKVDNGKVIYSVKGLKALITQLNDAYLKNENSHMTAIGVLSIRYLAINSLVLKLITAMEKDPAKRPQKAGKEDESKWTQIRHLKHELIKPIQRGPRYMLLAKELNKYAVGCESETNALFRAIEVMCKTINYISGAYSASEQMGLNATVDVSLFVGKVVNNKRKAEEVKATLANGAAMPATGLIT